RTLRVWVGQIDPFRPFERQFGKGKIFLCRVWQKLERRLLEKTRVPLPPGQVVLRRARVRVTQFFILSPTRSYSVLSVASPVTVRMFWSRLTVGHWMTWMVTVPSIGSFNWCSIFIASMVTT